MLTSTKQKSVNVNLMPPTSKEKIIIIGNKTGTVNKTNSGNLNMINIKSQLSIAKDKFLKTNLDKGGKNLTNKSYKVI